MAVMAWDVPLTIQMARKIVLYARMVRAIRIAAMLLRATDKFLS
ncbi:hypothetical protein EDF68_11722 [Ochrobactrum sp. BH3]|nr:hypothetical protein EDF68_11722 [Ochrobactrum sp. BH3]